MQRQRDLLMAIACVLLGALGLIGWHAVSRARAGAPPLIVGEATAPSTASNEPSVRPPPSDTPQSALPNPPSKAPATLRVHVAGAVRKPAVYTLPRDARVDDAVRMAGGATGDADLERVNLADFLKDGEQVRIPRKSERHPPQRRSAVARRLAAPAPPDPSTYRSSARYPRDTLPAPVAAPRLEGGSAAPATATGKVNLNTATAAELDTLPGVGPATAEAILEYRRQHGRFMRIEEIMEVRGIGEKKFARMKDRLTVR